MGHAGFLAVEHKNAVEWEARLKLTEREGFVRLEKESEMTLTERLFEIATMGAEWVLWLLLFLSLISVAVMAERAFFLARRRIDVASVQRNLAELLDTGHFDDAQKAFEDVKAMEGRVLHAGLEKQALGLDAVSELMTGALVGQKQLYERRLPYLATLGANAPFIGLFGTVLGIIQAFAVFDINGGPEASAGIMSAISEALIATGVGLLVAIPAVVAYNLFNTRSKQAAVNTEQLVRTFLAHLSAKPVVAERRAE